MSKWYTVRKLLQVVRTTMLFSSCQGNELFNSLSAEEHRRTMKLLESSILATDLALYFQ